MRFCGPERILLLPGEIKFERSRYECPDCGAVRYAQFKRTDTLWAPGGIEAGEKSVIGQRLKQSGMKWTVRGADALIVLRCITASDRTADYREQRAG